MGKELNTASQSSQCSAVVQSVCVCVCGWYNSLRNFGKEEGKKGREHLLFLYNTLIVSWTYLWTFLPLLLWKSRKQTKAPAFIFSSSLHFSSTRPAPPAASSAASPGPQCRAHWRRTRRLPPLQHHPHHPLHLLQPPPSARAARVKSENGGGCCFGGDGGDGAGGDHLALNAHAGTMI